MKPVRILVDSTVDLPERCRAQVRAVPLTVHFGDEELIDGVTIDRRRFYERLIESDVLPTTSQATPAAFVKEFEAVRQAGEYDVDRARAIRVRALARERKRGVGVRDALLPQSDAQHHDNHDQQHGKHNGKVLFRPESLHCPSSCAVGSTVF